MFSSLSFWGDEREGRGCNVRCGAFNSSVFEFAGSGTFLTPCTTREGEATSVPHLSHWLVQHGSDTATLALVKLNEKLRKNQVSYLMSEPWCFPWGCILTWKPSGSYKHLRANPCTDQMRLSVGSCWDLSRIAVPVQWADLVPLNLGRQKMLLCCLGNC